VAEAKDTPQETAAAEAQPEKVYPGGLDRYTELRRNRQAREAEGLDDDPGLIIAEELAGLAYLLDGIRYAARQNR
jgi:hypothetical protein